MKESHSANVLQSYFSLPCVAGGEAWVPPFSPLPGRSLRRRLVQSKQLQPDYVSSFLFFIQCVTCHRDKKHTGYLFNLVIIAMFRYKDEVLVAEGVSQGEDEFSPVFKLF